MEAEHCLICGNTHSGNCDPGAFNYYQCKSCGIGQQLPWDAVAFNGLENTYCACNEEASECWESIDYTAYKEIEEAVFTDEHIEILKHTQKNGLFCGGSKEMDLLVERKYMAEAGRKSFVPDMYYKLTNRGTQMLAALAL